MRMEDFSGQQDFLPEDLGPAVTPYDLEGVLPEELKPFFEDEAS
jgi:hypothetical protein